jgi:sigma-B regulation protein RsbU (phosphoserine phosphatase)
MAAQRSAAERQSITRDFVMKKPTLQLTLLGLLFIWALASQLAYSSRIVSLELRSGQSVEKPFILYDYGTTVKAVPPPYNGGGLQDGDELTAINGIDLHGEDQLERFWSTAKPNDLLIVSVRRAVNGHLELHNLALRLQAHTRGSAEWPMAIILSVVLPISCLLVGFYIAFAMPTDPLAWITMTMLASFSQLIGNGTSQLLVGSAWRETLFIYHPVLNDTWPVWMVLFALYFPVPFQFVKRKAWIGWLLAAPFATLAAMDIYGNFVAVKHLQRLRWLARFESSAETSVTVCFTIFVFLFFGLLSAKGKTLTNPDLKRRLRLMLYGCSAALTPTFPLILGGLGVVPRMPFWAVSVCLSTLVLFPATMAYVIVVQRTMDVRMVVRSGVQYAFASTGIRILQIGILVVVVSQTVRLAQETNHWLAEALIIALGVALMSSIRKVTERVRGWMDRRFFREAYRAEIILTDLSSSVAGIRDVKVLLETITKRISESLHVPCISVFLERNGAFRPAYALGSLPPLDTVEFKRETGVVSFLKRQQGPSKIYFGDPQNWIHGAPEAEQETLRKLDTQLLLPVLLKNRLLGIISLGAKRSEEPYSRGDLQLLSAVASQTGLALENAELTESVRHEIAQRERLDRELEIAREVQQRLFPQTLPIVKGLDFAGYCRPAEGVGGDYYDFIHLPDGSLGIAVGDVSGKGIAAALMMASLQASLRGQTIKPCDTLSEMIQHINRLVYEASSDNRYATFFYAQYDPATLLMRYVNAGHNPPLIWRQRNGKDEFIRLEDGGTVVGLFPESPFSEGLVQLTRGDVVVAFTDGISEAMNSLDEEYGEDRLTDAICAMQARTAADMITYILTKVDGFTAGAKQHDDMTLVVIQVQ